MTISIGLASLVFAAMLLAQMIGLFPDQASILARTQSELATTIAVACTQYIQRDDARAMSVFVADTVRRNDDIESAAVRTAGGNVLLECGDHVENWPDMPTGTSQLNYIQIPIFANGKQWGDIELRFKPPITSTFLGITAVPWIRTLLFVGGVAFILFWLYLKRVLRHLDPMSVIPDRVRVMMNTLAEAIFILDAKGHIVFANAAFIQLAGMNEQHLQGRSPESLPWLDAHEPTKPQSYPWTRCADEQRPVKDVLLKFRAPDDTLHTLSVNAAAVTGPGGDIRGMLVTLGNMTDIETKNVKLAATLESLDQAHRALATKTKELEMLATRDSLTGFLNRRAFYHEAATLLKNACQREDHVACIMIDLDHFKTINDEWGHQAGDEILRRVANAITDALRNDDIIGRYGGEEFAVVIADHDGTQAALVGERIRQTIEDWPMPYCTVTASVGVAIAAPWREAAALQELISAADKALYDAKRNGRNRVVIANDNSGPRRRMTDAPKPTR